MAAVRPTRKQYEQALDYFRTGQPIDQIGERLGLDADQLDRLEHDGWPAEGGDEAMPALRAQVLDRLVRLRAGELDTLAAVVEGASKTSTKRAQTSETASQIENAIVTVWGRIVMDAMRRIEDARKKGTLPTVTDLASLLTPKAVHDNLRALRRIQDPMVDLRYTAIFHRASARGSDEDGAGGDSLEAEIIKDLARLSTEELDEYTRTGRLPSRQQELFEEP